MNLAPGWAPNLHPLIIHFPIALLVAAAILDGLALILIRKWWPARASAVLYGIGALSAVLAWLTGRVAADSVFVAAEAQSLLSAHSDWALWTMLFFVVLASARLVLALRQMDSTLLRGAAFSAGLLGVLLLYQTGDRGARMVFGYGVGTGALITAPGGQVVADTGEEGLGVRAVSGLRMGEDGSWYWQAGPGALGDLLARFRWLDGHPEELSPRLVRYPDSTYAVELRLEGGPLLMASAEAFEDVQVDLEVDLADFKGSLSLVHHVQGPDTFDFLTLAADNAAVLGRRAAGADQVMERDVLESRPQGIITLSAVGAGTHFRGYLNEELLVHGHGDEAKAGGAGLRLEGTGTVRIRRLNLRSPDAG